MSSASTSPIEDYLDNLLRRTHADARTIRRILDEANDHLLAAADDLVAAGMPRAAAEQEAVRRLGPATDLARAAGRQSLLELVGETLRAAGFLGGCGLVAVGLSGGVAAVMNAVAGDRFVGGASVLGTGGSTIAETAGDAVTLRVAAGLLGLLALSAHAWMRRRARWTPVLPAGLVDSLGSAAFAAAALALVAGSIDQAVTAPGTRGVGFFLSGALVAVPATALFVARATRALLAPPALPGLPHRP